MRRPWIKIETTTPDKPEICTIATHLRMDPDAVLGKLVRLWTWAELNRINPNDLGVTMSFMDKLVGRKGFAAALVQSGWLVEAEQKLSFPNFQTHNGEAGKNRAMTALRVKRHRLRQQKNNDADVTEEPAAAVENHEENSILKDDKYLENSEKEQENSPEVATPEAVENFPIAEAVGHIHESQKDNETVVTIEVGKTPPKRSRKTDSADSNQPSLFD